MSENFTYQSGDHCIGGSSPLYRSGTDLCCTGCSYNSGPSMSKNFTYQSGDHSTGSSWPLYRSGTALGCTGCSYNRSSSMSENCTNQSRDHCTGSSSPLYRSGTVLGCTGRSTVVHQCPRISPTSPHVRHILSWRLGHENISMPILPLPLIQEEQLSVTGERMCICLGGLPRNSVARLTDRARNDLKCVEGL